MAVNDKTATILKIDLDTSELDELANLNIPGLSGVVSKLKKKIENGTDRAAESLADRLIDLDKVFLMDGIIHMQQVILLNYGKLHLWVLGHFLWIIEL